MTAGALLLLAIITYPVWSPRARRLRKQARGVPVEHLLGFQKQDEGIHVSRMFTRLDENGEYLPHFNLQAEDLTGTGPAWEQDHPYPEIFEDEESDDE